MRVSGIKAGAPRASPLPQDMLYTFSWRYILSGGRGNSSYTRRTSGMTPTVSRRGTTCSWRHRLQRNSKEQPAVKSNGPIITGPSEYVDRELIEAARGRVESSLQSKLNWFGWRRDADAEVMTAMKNVHKVMTDANLATMSREALANDGHCATDASSTMIASLVFEQVYLARMTNLVQEVRHACGLALPAARKTLSRDAPTRFVQSARMWHIRACPASELTHPTAPLLAAR